MKLSSIHLDRRLKMFLVLFLILNVDVDAGVDLYVDCHDRPLTLNCAELELLDMLAQIMVWFGF